MTELLPTYPSGVFMLLIDARRAGSENAHWHIRSASCFDGRGLLCASSVARRGQCNSVVGFISAEIDELRIDLVVYGMGLEVERSSYLRCFNNA